MKQYPKTDTPYEVLWAREDRLKVPDLHLKHLPAPNLPVIQFLEHELPPQSAEIITTKAQSWYHCDMPTTDIHVLLKRPIPPAAFLHDLEKEFGQAWFDGARSIVDHRFNNSTDCFPLWVLTFWRKLSETVATRSNWRKGCQWLDSEENKTRDVPTIDAVCATREILASLGWNVRLTYLQSTVTSAHLATLLGTMWLNDDHIDMMMEELSKEVASNPSLTQKVIITKLFFAQQVLNVNGKYTRKNAPLLCRYKKHIKDNDTEELYFPIHVNMNHWIAGCIHFKSRTINFGKFSLICHVYKYITHTKLKVTRLMIPSLYQGNFYDHSRAGCDQCLAKISHAKEIQWSMVAKWMDIHAGSSWATL